MIPTVIYNNIEEVKTLMAPYVPYLPARGLLPVVACAFFTIFMVEMYRMFTARNALITDYVVERRVAGRRILISKKEVKRGWGGVVIEERRSGLKVEKKEVSMVFFWVWALVYLVIVSLNNESIEFSLFDADCAEAH